MHGVEHVHEGHSFMLIFQVQCDNCQFILICFPVCQMLAFIVALLSKFVSGAEKLVRHLHSNKVPIAIATGSHKEEFILKTQNHMDVFGLFSHSVLSSEDPDVKNGKPAPDCFLVAAERFSDKPQPDKVRLSFAFNG